MEFQTRSCISLVILLSLSLSGTLDAFKLVASGSMTHNHITTAAILNITADVCKALAQQEGRDFVLSVSKFKKKNEKKTERKMGKDEKEDQTSLKCFDTHTLTLRGICSSV